jgi:DNA recombination protein RmuC
VWEVLGAVKTEFAKFGAVLDKTKKKLKEASDTIDDAQTRSNVMTRKLKSVEALPQTQTDLLLPGADALSVDDDPA